MGLFNSFFNNRKKREKIRKLAELKRSIAESKANLERLRNDPEYLEMKEKYNIEDNWVDARVWEESAMQDTISPLIEQLEQMDFIIVSEKSKRELPVKYKDFVEVPAVDCYLEKENIKKEIKNLTKKYDRPVFGFSASMATNVIVDELFEEIGDKCWMIDFGSIWEAAWLPKNADKRAYKLNKNHIQYK